MTLSFERWRLYLSFFFFIYILFMSNESLINESSRDMQWINGDDVSNWSFRLHLLLFFIGRKYKTRRMYDRNEQKLIWNENVIRTIADLFIHYLYLLILLIEFSFPIFSSHEQNMSFLFAQRTKDNAPIHILCSTIVLLMSWKWITKLTKRDACGICVGLTWHSKRMTLENKVGNITYTDNNSKSLANLCILFH